MFASKYQELHGWLVNKSKSGTNGVVASSDSSIFLASVRLTLLNMFVRSSKSSALDGGFWSCSIGWLLLFVFWFLSMNRLTAMAVVCATKSTPPGIWIPYWPPFKRMGLMSSVRWTSAVLAATLRAAVPMPMGRSFSRLFRSLWRARK